MMMMILIFRVGKLSLSNLLGLTQPASGRARLCTAWVLWVLLPGTGFHVGVSARACLPPCVSSEFRRGFEFHEG